MTLARKGNLENSSLNRWMLLILQPNPKLHWYNHMACAASSAAQKVAGGLLEVREYISAYTTTSMGVYLWSKSRKLCVLFPGLRRGFGSSIHYCHHSLHVLGLILPSIFTPMPPKYPPTSFSQTPCHPA